MCNCQRPIILLFLLLGCGLAFPALAAPTFTDQNLAAGNLNPGDSIVVQTIRMQGDATRSLVINAVTVQNLGTADYTQIARIEVLDGGTVFGERANPTGLTSGGETINVGGYPVAARADSALRLRVTVASATAVTDGATVKLEVKVHYVLNGTAFSSGWIVDGGSETIRKGGFDEVDEVPISAGNFDPGDQGVVLQVGLSDDDANGNPIVWPTAPAAAIAIDNSAGTATNAEIETVTLVVNTNGTDYTATKPWQPRSGGGVDFTTANFTPALPNVADDRGITITARMRITPAPTAEEYPVSPRTLDLRVEAPGSTQGTFTIRNTGATTLSDSIVVDPRGLTVTPDAWTLAPDQVQLFTVTWVKGSVLETTTEHWTIRIGGPFGTVACTGTATPGGHPLSASVLPLATPAPTMNGRTIRPRVTVNISEGGQGYAQQVTASQTQRVRYQGFEAVEERSAHLASGSLNASEYLTQIVRLTDDDVNVNPLQLVGFQVHNMGTATGADLSAIEVYRDGQLLGRAQNPSQITGLSFDLNQGMQTVEDDGSVTLSVLYYVSRNAVPGHTLQPRVQVRALEGVMTAPISRSADFWSNDVTYPDVITLYAPGFEQVKNAPDGPAGGACYSGQRFLAQAVLCVEQDQQVNSVTINPVVVKNLGTAVGGTDVVKIEITDQDGKPLGSSTDLMGFSTGGVSISTTQNNVVVDRPGGAQITLQVYVTVADPESAHAGGTLQLETRVLHTEAGVGYDKSATGPAWTVAINHRPTVDFTFTPAVPNVGQTASFKAVVADPDGDAIALYSWQFGTGRGSASSQEKDPAYAFADGGNYEVTLTATDSKGLSGSVKKTVPVNRPPTVSFVWLPEFPDLNASATFTSTVTDPDSPQDTPFTYAWDFGDSGKSGQASPTHAFAERKTYQVTLTVTDARKGVATVTHSVTVGNRPPVVDFSWKPTAPDLNQDVTFTPTATDPDSPPDTPFTYAWAFGDRGTSDVQTPTHRFADRGTYTVSLTVTDSRRGATTVTHDVSIGNQPPVAAFTPSKTSAKVGDVIQFTNTSSDPDGTIASWSWDFGDHTTSSLQNPTHAYASGSGDRPYSVILVVTDNKGAKATATQTISVVGPVAILTHSYPNPASTEARIIYYLPEGTTDLSLRVYELSGKLVLQVDLPSALSTYVWNLVSDSGDALPTGLYFYVITGKDAAGKAIASPVFKLLIAR